MLSQYLAANACSVKQMIRQIHGRAHVATGFLDRKCKIHLLLNVYFVFEVNEQCSPKIKGLHVVLLTHM